MAKRRTSPAPESSDERVLATATLRAAERLQITSRTLAAILGLSEPTISRMKKGEFSLQRGQKPFEIAALFVRMYRSLDSIVAGDDAVARAWLQNENTAIGRRPVDAVQSIQGLVNVVQYLDSRRALV